MTMLIESVRQYVLAALPDGRRDAELVNHLQGLDAHGLLVVYHNWMSRMIQPRPRRVLKSRELVSNPVFTARQADIDALAHEIEAGSDLTKYLSRGVKVAAGLPGRALNRRRDLDLMLVDWEVHHLHISQQVEADGFVKRDDPLLFALFKPTTAYLIDVMRHGDWTRDHVLRTIHGNWPNAGLVYEIKGVVGLAQVRTEADRAKLRSRGVNSLVDIGDVVLRASGAISTAGTSCRATRDADRLLDAVEAFQSEWLNQFPSLKRKFEAQGFLCPDDATFEFTIQPTGAGVIETKSRTFIRLG